MLMLAKKSKMAMTNPTNSFVVSGSLCREDLEGVGFRLRATGRRMANMGRKVKTILQGLVGRKWPFRPED